MTDAQWVNTSVTFVKDDAGALSLWIQPKISPSWTEEKVCHRRMFAGRAVKIFGRGSTTHCPAGSSPFFVMTGLDERLELRCYRRSVEEFDGFAEIRPSPAAFNGCSCFSTIRPPNHVTLLTAAHNFLSLPDPAFVQRHDAAVVMVCTANAKAPARSNPNGYSSFIFGLAPRSIVAGAHQPLPRKQPLEGIRSPSSVQGRRVSQMGECIHTVEVRVPRSVVPNATDRTAALVEARTFPLCGNASADPRIPGGPVPAVVKWVNDELDMVTDGVFTGTAIETDLKTAHGRTVKAYRNLKSQVLAVRVDATCAKRASTVPQKRNSRS